MIKAIDWAFDQDLPQPGMKLVLVALANYANEDWQCWPSQQTLAKIASMSVRAVRDNLKRLEELGLIARTPRIGEFGHHQSNVYQLRPKPAAESASGSNCPRTGGSNCRSPEADAAGDPEAVTASNPSEKNRQERTVNNTHIQSTLQIVDYGRFGNVRLSVDDQTNLAKELGVATRDYYIEALSEYMKSKGKQYRNHLAAIYGFIRRDKRRGEFPPTTQPNRTKNGERKFDPNE